MGKIKFTNKLNLPSVLLRMGEQHEHKGGYLSASATSDSPRQFQLKQRHSDEVIEDISDRIWALFGEGWHYYVRQFAPKTSLAEEYLSCHVLGKSVTGTSDFYDGETNGIIDWKTTSVWNIIFGSSMESWEKQTNTYGFLFREYGFVVDELWIIALLRDWHESGIMKNPDYPKVQVQKIPIKLWSFQDQKDFLIAKVSELLKYEDTPDDELPDCSPKDRWAVPDKWAIMKEGRKKALAVLDDRALAQKRAETESANGKKVKIEYRQGKSNKCLKYCNICGFCNQWQREKSQ